MGCAGISVADDLVVVAYLNHVDRLRDVRFFAHESLKAFRACPYINDWKRFVTLYGDKFNLARILEDALRESTRLGFDPSEVTFKNGDSRVVEVPKSESPKLDRLLRYVQDGFFGEVWGIAEEKRESLSAMLKYYWDSLRSAGEYKVLSGPTDRTEPIRAILNALYAAGIIEMLDKAAEDVYYTPPEEVRSYALTHSNNVCVQMRSDRSRVHVPLRKAIDLVKSGQAEYFI
jgi:hypothetical protein